MKYRLLDDRILVRLIREEKSKGGIHLPDSDKTKPRRAEVLVVGPGRVGPTGTRIPIQVQAGDLIHYLQYDGVERSVLDNEGDEQRNWRIIQENDIRVVEVAE